MNLIDLHNNTPSDIDGDCPPEHEETGLGYWHFVIVPNNGTLKFKKIILNLAGTLFTFHPPLPDPNYPKFILNGIQLDNVYVPVPSGYTLASLLQIGSYAEWEATAVGATPKNFILSHLCQPAEIPCFIGSTRICCNRNEEKEIAEMTLTDQIQGVAIEAILSTEVPAGYEMVCFKSGALGPQLPYRDLLCTPSHLFLVNQKESLASQLVNGKTIVKQLLLKPTRVYHILMKNKKWLWLHAQGLSAETLNPKAATAQRYYRDQEKNSGKVSQL